MAYTRRQELTCTEDQMRAKPNVVLRENEVIYIKMNNGTLRQKIGDGVNTIINLPFTQVFDGNVVQTTGGSETDAMSQKATSEALDDKVSKADIGFNIWDEQVRVYGSYIASKNRIPVKPNTQYYFSAPANPSNGLTYWDADGNKITTTNNKGLFTTPDNCYQISFGMASSYGTQYNNDICINISQPNELISPHNGEYVPYSEHLKYSDIVDMKVDTAQLQDELFNGNVCPVKDSTYNQNGVTITPQGDGSYVLNGVPTQTVTYYIYENANKLPDGIYPGRTYRFGIEPVTKEHAQLSVVFWHSAGGYESKAGAMFEFQCPSDCKGFSLQLKVLENHKCYNIKVTPFVEDVDSFHYIKHTMSIDDRPRPLMSIIDDDGNKRFHTYLLPLIKNKHASITAVVPTKIITEPNSWSMSADDIKECYFEGAEILSHTHSHWVYNDIVDENGNRKISYEQQIADYRRSKNILHSLGINCVGVGHSGDSPNAYGTVECAKLAGFDYGLFAGNALNLKGCISRYEIFERTINEADKSLFSLDKIKTCIDKLVNSGTGWLCLGLHTSYDEWANEAKAQELVQRLSDAIDYARSFGIDIVSTEAAAKYYLN